jgi:LPXTG-motif cell wall-anchored protein
VVRVGECGAPSEAFEVLAKDPATPLRPPLASTGGSSAQPFLLVSGILLLAAALTAVLVRRHRGRRARVRECRDMAEALE